MKITLLTIILILGLQFSFSQNSANADVSNNNVESDSTIIAKKNKQKKSEETTARLIREQDSLLKLLAEEEKLEAERIKNKLPRTDYYKNGQNGIELIAKLRDIRIVVSLYDSKPALKEIIANELFEFYNKKFIEKDTVLTIITTNASVTGHCKIKNIEKNTDISFYFHKIVWKNGLTEIHEGESFIAKPSSAPFLNPETRKKVVFEKK